MSRAVTTLALVLGASLLSACSILPKSEPSNVYLLPAAPAVNASTAAPVNWSLRVAKPQAVMVLDSPRIAVVPEGSVISSYQGARWSDNGPVLLRDRLLDGFQADGRIRELSSDDAQLQADLVLVSDLRAFQSEYSGGQVAVVVRLDVQLVQGASRKIVAARRFDIRQPASSAGVADVVAAFGQASNSLSAQLVPWVVQQGEHSRQP
ncbi:MAG: ABC-type transport auxiliary lipoprotein family protein [Pseudomonas sp.]|uniref:ABC-type transport auxiliary lipoprotein family protein n=1 Tax=Pseudomonas sp. TaxID=306 RepID=UPI0030F0FB78